MKFVRLTSVVSMAVLCLLVLQVHPTAQAPQKDKKHHPRPTVTHLGTLEEIDRNSGALLTFLATPCDAEDADNEVCKGTLGLSETIERQTVVVSENVRQLRRQRSSLVRFVRTSWAPFGRTTVTSATTVTLSPNSLTFSTRAIGTRSAAKVVTLKNTGTSNLAIIGIAITGTNAGDFTQTHNCGSSLVAGASCTINVTFEPTGSGTRMAVLSIMDNAAGNPQRVTLTGIGTKAKLSPTSLSFGSVVIDTTSSPQTVTLTNVGTSSLSITGIAITGTNAGDFAQTHNCGTSLTGLKSCSINVTFRPTASGTRAGALSISDNGGGSPQTVPLKGTGVAGRCTPLGMQCPPQFPPCCPGLVCVPASTRAFCEPAGAGKSPTPQGPALDGGDDRLFGLGVWPPK